MPYTDNSIEQKNKRRRWGNRTPFRAKNKNPATFIWLPHSGPVALITTSWPLSFRCQGLPNLIGILNPMRIYSWIKSEKNKICERSRVWPKLLWFWVLGGFGWRQWGKRKSGKAPSHRFCCNLTSGIYSSIFFRWEFLYCFLWFSIFACPMRNRR